MFQHHSSTNKGDSMAIQTSKIPILLGVLVSLQSFSMAQTTSGLRYERQPVVMATDEYGNIDKDYKGSVTLSSEGVGVLGGALTQVASAGNVTYHDISYSATADNEAYTIIASDGSLSEANSSLILSDVVATQLIFTTQATPSSLHVGIEHDFTTDPVVKAVDAQGLVDVNFSETISLSQNGVGNATFNNNSTQAIAGVASFTDLTFNYDTAATIQLVANDQDDVGLDFEELLSDDVTISVKPISIVVPVDETQTTAQFDDAVEVEIEENDGVQTAVVKVDDRVINIAVQASGVMSGTVESQDDDGNTVNSSIEVASSKSDTTVDAQGNMETTVETDNSSTVKVTVNSDGSVKHEVQTSTGLTVAVSAIAGADVKVDEQGNISTTSEVEKDGFVYKAVVTTSNSGETSTKFVKIDLATNEQTDLSNTLEEGENFALGNEANVLEIDDVIYIEVIAPLDEPLIIE